MKVAIKNRNTLKYIDPKDIEVSGVTLEEFILQVAYTQELFRQLSDEVKNSHIVKKDTAYIIEIDGELKRIQSLNLFEESNKRFPLHFYEVKDGKIILNKKKVGAI